MTKTKEMTPPDHWSEIDPDVRRAMVEQGKDRLFWKSAFARLGAFSKFAQVLLVIFAFVAALRSGLADWVLGVRK
ncbi:MAG: hypothetical protein ACPGSI_13220 [Pikeienuella sp.]